LSRAALTGFNATGTKSKEINAVNEPDIVKDLGLSSARELRFHWRRLKELGKLPLTSRVGVEGKFGQDSRRATGERDLLLERLLKVHDEPRNDLFKKDN